EKRLGDPPTRVSGDGAFRLTTIPGPGLLLARNEEGRFLRAVADPADKDRLPARGKFIVESANAYRVIEPEKPGQKLEVDFQLIPGKTKEVSLLDPDGKPLTGVVVDNLADQVDQWKTLEQATATVVGLDVERPRPVTFLHPDRKLAAAVTLKGDEEGPVQVRLEPWGTITGRMLDETGKPIAGARIELYHRAQKPDARV